MRLSACAQEVLIFSQHVHHAQNHMGGDCAPKLCAGVMQSCYSYLDGDTQPSYAGFDPELIASAASHWLLLRSMVLMACKPLYLSIFTCCQIYIHLLSGIHLHHRQIYIESNSMHQ